MLERYQRYHQNEFVSAVYKMGYFPIEISVIEVAVKILCTRMMNLTIKFRKFV